MNLIGEHLSKSYDQDLQNLVNLFLKMGGMAEANLTKAIESLVKSDVACQYFDHQIIKLLLSKVDFFVTINDIFGKRHITFYQRFNCFGEIGFCPATHF